MYVTDTSCCAVGEIDGLREYLDNPKGALLALLERETNNEDYDPWSSRIKRAKMITDLSLYLDAHYIFTGVEETDYVRPDYLEDDEEDDEEVEVGYAEQFYKFLRENKLGKVVRGAPEYNRKNHPGHLVRVYIWTPDIEAVNAWYQKYKRAR